MRTPHEWKQVCTEEVADCKVFTVRKDLSENLETGAAASFFVCENPDWVNIIPITENDEVVLIEQFRHGVQEFTLEIPGGMIDKGESAKSAAKRELLEETGYDARDLVEIGISRPNPALQSNRIYHFAAHDCRHSKKPDFDEHESIVTHLVSLNEIPDLIVEGKITHSLVVAAFHYLQIGNFKAL